MEYIGARVGDSVFYIEKDRIRALVERPEIYRVPDCTPQLEGISLYKDRLVMYGRIGKADNIRCGVVFDAGETVWYGIAADDLYLWDEEETPQELRPVMTGVWVLDDGEINGG